MKRFILLLSVLFSPLLCSGISQPKDSIEAKIKRLIACIDESDIHIKEQEEKLHELTIAIDTVKGDPMLKYQSIMEVALEYSRFTPDSAVFYYERGFNVAKEMNREDLMAKVRLHQAKTLVLTGYYLEAHTLLSHIERRSIPEESMVNYYATMTDLYKAMSREYVLLPVLSEEFQGDYECYRDSLLNIISPDSPRALRLMEIMASSQGRMEEAFEYNDKRREVLGPDLSSNALVHYDRYILICQMSGSITEEAIAELLTSAIIDVKLLNQDIASLLPIEQYLSAHNRFKEAKKVSDYYYSTMIRYGSRVRQMRGFKQSMAINKDYVRMLTLNRRILVAALFTVSLLIVALIIILLFVASARRKLSVLNEKLTRSDKIATAYMTHFFQLYSAYIESMTSFRSKISTMLHRGQVDRAISMTAPSKENEMEEIRSMMNNFDSAFISVYPDFVDEFNSMLKDEYRITPKANEIMTVELRVFALIKMGVEDSGEIADALHLSIKTVYNKRSEIKNKLNIPHEEFLRKLKEI